MNPGFDYIRVRNYKLTTYFPDGTSSEFNGVTWNGCRAEIMRILNEYYYEVGTLSDDAGNLYLINACNVTYTEFDEDTLRIGVTFDSGDILVFTSVTAARGGQDERYLKFIIDANNLDRVRKGRNVKFVVPGATQTDSIFPDFASLQSAIMPGDYVIATAGTHTMNEFFQFANGVDIEFRENPTLRVNYDADTSIGLCAFTDHAEPFASLDNDTRAEIADTTKKITARIFGRAVIEINDCPSNKFMPIIRNYYDSNLFIEAAILRHTNTNGAVLYSFQGTQTARIKNVPQVQRLIDNDYLASVCDLDTLSADVSYCSFFPGSDVSAEDPTAIIRNATITNSGGRAIDTIALAIFDYHYVNVRDEGSALFFNSTFAGASANMYAHFFKCETDEFYRSNQVLSFYNNNFLNQRNNTTDGGGVNYYYDSLTSI